MHSFHRGKDFSLLDMATCLLRNMKINISKQSLHDRFNEKAVSFFKDCLCRVLSHKLGADESHNNPLKIFNRERIKDSTRFSLPDNCSEKYRGYGGALHNSKSMVSIQYEYDLLTGQPLDLRLTDGRKNDQSDSRDFTGDIQKGDLFIRDLGYTTLGYLEKKAENDAYFLNRLAPNINVYPDTNTDKAIDFGHYLKKLRKHPLPFIELKVFLGKKDRVPSRLVITPVDERTYEKRIRKTAKQTRSHGNKMSENFKERAAMSVFITNVEHETIDTSKIMDVYALRWQIELIFKIWKSQLDINGVKKMKTERFECELIAKLIWLVLTYHLFSWLNSAHYQSKGVLCSVWKYFKLVTSMGETTVMAFQSKVKLKKLVNQLMSTPLRLIRLEKKNGKRSLIQSLALLN